MSFSIAISPAVQVGAAIGAGTSVAPAQKATARTFSLTGTMGTTIVPGDVVDIWGSNDGGRTFQPLRTAANKIVRLTFDNPECVINDCCDAYATQRVAVGTGSALVALGLNCELASTASNAWVQGGNAFGAIGVLGTQDAFAMTIIAESKQVFSSDGVTTQLGNIDATVPGNSLNLLSGSGGAILDADNGGAVSLLTDTGPIILSGADVRLIQNAAGLTTPLRFFELIAGGTEFVAFKAPAAIAASVTWTLPNADATLAGRPFVSDAAGTMSFGPAIQSGAANLTNGVSGAIAANIAATSRIFIQAADVVPGAGNLTIDYRPLAADRVNGTPGSFKITAVLADGTINALDQSQGVQWMVINQ